MANVSQEFEEKDYERARDIANKIKNEANKLDVLFNNEESEMNRLYGEAWMSSGASSAHSAYDDTLKSHYNRIRDKIIQNANHVLDVTQENETADAQAKQNVESALKG